MLNPAVGSATQPPRQPGPERRRCLDPAGGYSRDKAIARGASSAGLAYSISDLIGRVISSRTASRAGTPS
jgi:hypothetical protein